MREDVPFYGFRFLPGLRPWLLGPTKQRFERRRRLLAGRRDFHRLTQSVFAWYQFSREGNSEGLRRAYCSWRPGWSGGSGRPPACVARWVVEQRRPGQSVVLEPQPQHPRESQQQHRFSVCWWEICYGRLKQRLTSPAFAMSLTLSAVYSS